jgi:hypothetical protein
MKMFVGRIVTVSGWCGSECHSGQLGGGAIVKAPSDLSKVPTGVEDYCIIVVWVHTVYPEKNRCTDQFTGTVECGLYLTKSTEHGTEEFPYMPPI